MVETAGIIIDLGACLHEAVSLIVNYAWCDGDVALVADHDLYVHAAHDGSLDGPHDGVVECEIGVDEQYALLCMVEAMDEGATNDFG